MARPRYERQQHIYSPDILGIVLAAGALFLLLALFSYDPYDATLFYATTELPVINNWCGVVGAYSAAFLFYFFGASSLYIVIIMGAYAYISIVHQSYTAYRDRWYALLLLFCLSAAWCYAYAIDFLGAPYAGGVVGMYIYKALCYLFDEVGALLCIYTLMMISLLIITRLSLIRIMYYGSALLKRFVSQSQLIIYMGRTVQRALVYSSAFLHVAISRISGWVVSVCSSAGDGVQSYDAYNYEQLDETLYDSAWWDTLASQYQEAAATPIVPIDIYRPKKEEVQPKSVVAPHQKKEETVVAQGASDVLMSIEPVLTPYTVPDVHMFPRVANEAHDQKLARELEAQAQVLEEKLARFGVAGKVTSIKRGPVVTLFEYQPDIDSKISKIVALEDDLALALQALSIRIIAPIPGRSVVGFEVSNKKTKDVHLAAILQSKVFTEFEGKLPLVLGQDTVGDNVVVDLALMPHLLVAGSTGSGKSVALNAMLVSLLCACSPDELRLILIDPKRLEFAPYADIAHLIFPIITDPRKATPALMWVVKEMELRYERMAAVGARNIVDYNKQCMRNNTSKLPYIIVVIDELADLMMTASREIEDLIARIAQMARAAGIHAIVATQRPSVDVITGLIKANFPSRISFRVASKIDSRTILDCAGADKLIGRGDMLFLDSRSSLLRRVHGAYVSDKEIEDLVQYIRVQRTVVYRDLMEEMPIKSSSNEPEDELYDEVVRFLQEIDEVSISLLQRKFRIGYNRSARIIDTLESRGLIMPTESGKTRKIIK